MTEGAEGPPAVSEEALSAEGSDSVHSTRGWLGKLRGRRWALLFLFEFFVILLGVLAAQVLTNAFADRAERRQATLARAALDRDLRSLGLSAAIRERVHLCEAYRLHTIATAVAESRALEMTLAPPDEALIVDFGWQGEVPSLIAEHFGRAEAERYANIALWAEAFARGQEDEQRSWAPIGRISRAFGEPSVVDFSAAKEGLAAAARDLQRVRYATVNIRRHLTDANLVADVEGKLMEYRGSRAAADPCEAAVGYSMEEHRAAAREGRLVTGERLSAIGAEARR